MTFQNRPISGRSLKGAALIAALVAAGALPVQAQQLAAGERATVATSDEVVVTASRIAETADETLAPVSVVTRAEIERRQIRSVPDALRQVPGLTLSNNGGVGKATSVFLRGTESDHVLVLINGVKVGSATLGTFNFESLSIDDVERIEVVRGPRSHLYGSEALGGIIQIFTRKPTDTTHAHASVGYGSNDTMEGTAGFSGRASGIGFSASTNYIRTDGINSCGNGTAIPGGGCFANQPDKDGFERSSVTGGLDYAFSNGIKVEATGLYATSENEYDGSASNESESVNYVLGLRALASPTDYWDVTASAGHTVDDSDNFLDGTYQSTFKTERNVLSLQNDLYLLQDQVTTLGVDFQRDQVDSDTGYVEDSRDNTGVFAQHRAEFGRHTVQLSGRVDENEQFGGYLTGGAAYGYRITDNLRATASYGTAFKAPSFNELYYPGFGNADLDPEMSESAEIGLAATVGGFKLGANLFHTEIDDLISYDSSIDPVGACVGMRGSRVQAVVGELQGEKIDIIPFSDDPATFVVNALAPAEVSKVVLDEDQGRIEVVVPDEQLSLAIGRRGQNVRLASMLTGWDIDILTEQEESDRRREEFRQRSESFIGALDIDDVIAGLLVAEGFASVEEIAYTDIDDLAEIEGFDADIAEELRTRAFNFVQAERQRHDDRRRELGVTDELAELEVFTPSMLVTLGENGVKTLDDLGDLASDELREILPDAGFDEDAANQIIMAARAHWFDGEDGAEANAGVDADAEESDPEPKA